MAKKMTRTLTRKIALVVAAALCLSGCPLSEKTSAQDKTPSAKAPSVKSPSAKVLLGDEKKTGSMKSRFRDILGILSGTLAWARNDWAMAAASFIETEHSAAETGNARLREYAAFGLASTYLAEDEYEAALARLEAIGEPLSGDIGSGLWYQAGIIAFRNGEYASASALFRKSLEYDPTQTDAKINLELSRRSLAEGGAKRAGEGSGFSEDGTSGDEAETIFNLVRKKEQDRWKNQEEETPREAVADY